MSDITKKYIYIYAYDVCVGYINYAMVATSHDKTFNADSRKRQVWYTLICSQWWNTIIKYIACSETSEHIELHIQSAGCSV